MNYKLKSNNGKINALLRTGKDFVTDTLTIAAAQHIIDSGELVESDKEDYPIHVGEWYFEGEPIVTEEAGKDRKPPFINRHRDKRGNK